MISQDPGQYFQEPTSSVRDTLEQIDISHQLMYKYSDVRTLMRHGKISALVGIEGGHQLGNSLGALRHFAARGVPYVTLTYACHNAFADSSRLFDVVEPLHHGLSPFISHYGGIHRCPTGVEDVSTYPVLIAELYSRGWSADELHGFTGGNFLPVFAGAENVVREGVAPAQDLYEKRTDIPKKH
ncbi:hypothetical protein EDB89DRAFT_2081612 [Lactarius sanguifluus]|nr:hypothetical protein EDB89DRAFT_2081612 [Lactarius sanguifluus]